MAKSIRQRSLALIKGIAKKPARQKAPDSTSLFLCTNCKKQSGMDISMVNVTFVDVRQNGRELLPDKINMSSDMRCAHCNHVVAHFVNGKWVKMGVV